MALPPNLFWLRSLSKSPTAGQLQTLAKACGIPASGTKRVVTDRVLASVANSRVLSANDRILSIDMGLRNFAFCLLTPTASTGSAHVFGGEGSEVQGSIDYPDSSGTATVSAIRTPPQLTLHDWRVLDLAEGGADVTNNQALSPIAVDLVNRHLLPLRPTHILIEQQRYRSRGAAAVQEWTLRVNALEAMLHAILNSMRSLDVWKGEVEAVDPSKAASFFFDEVGRAPSKMLKKMKIDLLGGWISAEDKMPLKLGSTQVKDLAVSYLDHWRKPAKAAKVGKSKTAVAAAEDDSKRPFKKLDDLTDCVVQGAAWASWQQTRHVLAQERVKELLGDK